MLTRLDNRFAPCQLELPVLLKSRSIVMTFELDVLNGFPVHKFHHIPVPKSFRYDLHGDGKFDL